MKARKAASLGSLIVLIGLAGCGGTSSSFSPAPPAPPPQPNILLSPTSVAAGSPDLPLTITAAGFSFVDAPHKVNEVVWTANGTDTTLTAVFVSSAELDALIPVALMSNPITAQVRVEIWDQQGDVPDATSSRVSFAVGPPAHGVPAGFDSTRSMMVARSGHTATLLMNGKVLIAGGDADATAELFDPATATFTQTNGMTTWRYGATATLLANGRVLITGGFGPGVNELPRLNTAELYDPLTGAFSETGSMALPRVMHTATLLSDGRVLITGGTTDSGGGGAATAKAELYDPTTGLFTSTGSMISDRAQHSAVLLGNGDVLIAGGWNGHRADAADDPPWDPLFAELFNPSGSFTSTGSMSTTRIGNAAIRLASGKILVLGGIPNPQNLHQLVDPKYAELYDPTAHTFVSVGSATMSRTGYTATLLTNGNVLLAGGEDLGQTVGTAELLDPSSGTLVTAGGLVTARKDHTATLLNDGRVLVVGGVDNNGNVLASAELSK